MNATIIKRYVGADGKEYAVVLLNIQKEYLSLVDEFLTNLPSDGQQEETTKNSKVLSIRVSEDMSARGKFQP